jgi:hypothetical protein
MAAKKAHGEVAAMGMVEEALEALEPDQRARVLRWASERYGVPLASSGVKTTGGSREQHARLNAPSEVSMSAGEFYSKAAPTTEPERALVVAYWVQQESGKGDFDSQTVNTQLKHLGHGVSNITRALDELKKQKPQLVIQLEKAGKAKQARKRYKVTAAGNAKVQEMLASSAE